MKIKSLIVVAGILALTGVSYAKEEAKKGGKKKISPELLEKYDTDKDGKLSKEERAEMKKGEKGKGKGDKKKGKKKGEEKKDDAEN